MADPCPRLGDGDSQQRRLAPLHALEPLPAAPSRVPGIQSGRVPPCNLPVGPGRARMLGSAAGPGRRSAAKLRDPLGGRPRLDRPGVLRQRLLQDPEHRPAGGGRGPLHAGLRRMHRVLADACGADDGDVSRPHPGHGLYRGPPASGRAPQASGLDHAPRAPPHNAGRGPRGCGLPHGACRKVAPHATSGAGRDAGLRA